MSIENASHINGLNPSFPTSGDFIAEGDDHIRLLKQVLQNDFPNITSTVAYSSTELNDLRANLTHTATTFNMHNNAIVGVVSVDANDAVQPRSYNDTRYLRSGISSMLGNNTPLTSSTTASAPVELIKIGGDNVVKVGSATQPLEFLGTSISYAGKTLFDYFYPVGCIYENGMSDTNPGDPSVFGQGTWVEFGAGKVLVGHDGYDVDFVFNGVTPKTGGSKTHTLTTGEMPSHTHALKDGAGGSATNSITLNGGSLSGQDNPSGWITSPSVDSIIQPTGSGLAHNNVQPYVVIKRWMRVA